MAQKPDYISASELKQMLTGPEKEKVLVVDVRGHDFAGGHVKGAKNIVSDRFADDDDVEQIIAEEIPEGVEKVVMHCALSQVRGPFCASRLASRLAAQERSNPKVVVLQGGFNNFVDVFGDDNTLVEYDDTSSKNRP